MIGRFLSSHGIATPDTPSLIALAIAGGLTIAVLFVGALVGRTGGPRLQALLTGHVAMRGELLARRTPAMVRHGTTAILAAIIVNAYPWPTIAALPLGLAMAAATGFVGYQLLRGLALPRWLCWSAGLTLFVIVFSRSVGGLRPIEGVLDSVGFDIGARRFSLLSLATILITVVALFAIVRLANRVIGHAIARSRALDATQQLLAQKLSSIAVVVSAFFIGIDLLGIDLTAFAVFGGAFGLAIGFGLQKTVGNLIAGIILLMDRSVKPGDVIVIGDKDVGRVKRIGVRAVSIITRDGKEHLIPNENLMTQEVENWSYTDRNVRVRIPVGVSYDCDLKLAQELMLRAASESPRVLNSPKPTVWLTDFGDNAVDHEILCWISDPEAGVGNMRSDVLNRLWWLFKEHGIGLPYPQRDVHIVSLPRDGIAIGPGITGTGEAPAA